MFESFNALVQEPMSNHTTLKLGRKSPQCLLKRELITCPLR